MRMIIPSLLLKLSHNVQVQSNSSDQRHSFADNYNPVLCHNLHRLVLPAETKSGICKGTCTVAVILIGF